ncbi:MAG: dienelactone hydrolase family protein [Alphaproteobacteria bacterium]
MTNADGDRIESREVEFRGKDATLRGHLAHPVDPAAARGGVVLFPDVFGLSGLYRRVARRIAGFGHVVLALDPYSREGTPTLPDMTAVMEWIASLPDDRVIGDVGSAVEHLSGLPGVGGRVAVLGFCLGGQYAIQSACRVPGLAACVGFYGMLRYDRHDERKPASPIDLAPRLSCPLLGLFGADDPLVPQEDRAALEAVLRLEGKAFSLHVFGGAGHAFANEERADAFRPETATVAWGLARDFLGRHLRG